MTKHYLIRSFAVIALLISIVSLSAKAQFGDYSVRVDVENSSQTFSHFTNVIFTNDFFGSQPTNGWDDLADSYALPPASGQPMVYTSITEPAFPTGQNELQFNTRPPLTMDWDVPMGFDAGAGVTDDFTFTVDWLYTLPGNVGVELEDLQLSVTQDLLINSTYTFSSSGNDPEARFILHFTLVGACPIPNTPTFTNVSDTHLDVLWGCSTCSGGETFIVEYGPSGFTPGNGSLAGVGGTIINPASPGVSITGLTPLTAYDIYVRSVCGTVYSSNSGVGQVTTLDIQCPVPDQGSPVTISETSADIFFSCPACVGGETVYLEYGPTGFTPGTGTTVLITGSTTTIGPLTGSTIYDVYFYTECGAPSPSELSTVLTFTTDGPTCAQPDPPTVSNIMWNQADVSWTCSNCVGGESFIVEYGPVGFTPGTDGNAGIGGTVIASATSPTTISGLIPQSTQNVYVRSYCGGTLYSINSQLLDFNTPAAPCPTPENVSASNITNNGADISWTCVNCTGSEQLILEYGPSGFTPGVDNTAGVGGTVIINPISPQSLTGLLEATDYDVYLRARCGSNDYSDNSISDSFTTTGTGCAIPEAPNVINITSTSVDVEWTCNTCSGGEQFILEYGPFDFPNNGSPFSTINPAVSPVSLSNLTPLTHWSVRIRTTCGGNSESDNSTLVNFDTPGNTCPEATFSVAPTTCVNTPVSFTDGTIGATTWQWSFGDGQSSSDQNPVHVYQTPGTFDVTLTITDGGICTDDTTLVGAVTVNPPLAAFSLTPQTGCGIPHTTSFTDLSTLPDTWLWSFGDGNTSTAQNPVHNYVTGGDFDILLTVTDTINGCTDTASAMVTVNADVADFQGAPLFGCGPLSTTFTESSSVSGSATIVSWDWSFGDGQTSTMQNPTHVYDAPGVYTVTLTVTDDSGCSDVLTRTNYIQVIGPNVDFGPDPVVTGCLPLSVSFTDSTIFGAPITNWDWSFGDGSGTSNLQNPTYTYTTNGSFDVSLTITDIDGCSRTETHVGNVIPNVSAISITCPGTENVSGCTFTIPDYTGLVTVTDPCDPSPTVTQSLLVGSVVDQNATVWVYAENSVGDLDSCSIDIVFSAGNLAAGCQPTTLSLDGNGNASLSFDATGVADQVQSASDGSSNGVTFYQSFQPGQNGIFNRLDVNVGQVTQPVAATLEIYSGVGTGGVMLHSQPVTLSTGALSIEVSGIIPLTMGSDYTFEISVTGGGNFSLLRDSGNPYGNGDSQTAGTDLLFTTYMLELPAIESGTVTCHGIQSVSLSQSSFSCADVGTVDVDLTITDFLGNSSQCTATVTIEDNENPVANCQNIDLYVDGNGNASIVGADVNGGSTDNCGITSMAVNPNTFDCSVLGPNTVTLTVMDGAGNTNTCAATVTVLDTFPPTAQCQDLTIYLDGNGDASITAGDVDNGSFAGCGTIVSTTINQTDFNCSNLGANTVTLIIEDSNANTSTCVSTVTVLDSIPPTITCPGDITICAADQNGIVVTFADPVHSDNCSSILSQVDVTGLSSGSVFPAGTTTLMYEAEDADGNVVSCSFDVTVNPAPDANYSYSAACLGETIFFTDESTIDPISSIVSWSWNFGDGSGIVTLVDPTHVYAATGTYTVTLTVVSDEGCAHSYSETVTVTEVPTAAFTATTECQGTATAFTNASSIDPGYSGNLNYSWDFGDGDSSSDTDPTHIYGNDGTFTVTLTVTTDDGCENMISQSVTVNEQPTALFVYSQSCLGDATDFTNLSVGSGLSYDWDFGGGNTSADENPTFTFATDGMHTVTLTVTNGNNCSHSVSMDVEIGAYPAVAFSFADGCEETSIDFTNTSDAGTYAWNFGDGNSSILMDVSNIYMNSGNYDVTLTVTNASGCVDQLTQQIEIFDNPEFTLTAEDVLCFGEATGSILVSPTLGAAPLDFILSGGTPQVSSTFDTLVSGMYDITIIDANGCETTDNIMVGQPAAALGVNVNDLVDLLCHGDLSGSINVNGTGGTTPYSYTLNGGSSQGNGLFTGLIAGTHDLNITDNNGCTFDTTLTLFEPDTLVLMVDSLGNLLCNGDNSGWINVAGTGGTMPYEYSIDGTLFDTPDMFTDLAAGPYTISVLDGNGCTDTVNVTLTEPGVLMLSLLEEVDAVCNGQASGLLTVEASSGTAPYQYSIDGGANWQGSGSFPGIGAGIYIVMVVDANGCTDEVNATIDEPAALTLATTTDPVLCVGDASGTIDITAGGGTPSYTYSIDGGANYVSTSSFIDLNAGNYVVVVQDTNGCTISESVVISQPSEALSGAALIQMIDCFGDTTGMITVQVSGGTGSYTYSIDGGVNWQITNVFQNLTAGDYQILVEDVNGCSITVDATVEQPANALTIGEILATSPTCLGDANGSITIVVSGGTTPYEYSTNGGANFTASNIISGLTAGTYNVVVLDANGCSISQAMTISDPEAIEITLGNVVGLDCEGDQNGEIHVTAAGGTGTLQFQINGTVPQSTGDFTGLTNGTFNIVVSDANGCETSLDVEILAVNPTPVASFTYIVAGETVEFTNTSLFGNQYSWDFGDGQTSTEENPVHVYGAPGIYDVVLTVTNECGTSSILDKVSTITFGVEDIEGIQDLNLFPNPSNGEFTLTFNLVDHIDVLNVEVFDMRGRSVFTSNQQDLFGDQQLPVNMNETTNGIYRLRLSADDHVQVIRIVIAR